MIPKDFCSGMNTFFKIPEKDAIKFADEILTSVYRSVKIDLFKFDLWLHEKHGEYEEKGMSMSDIIKLEYGKLAYEFIIKVI